MLTLSVIGSHLASPCCCFVSLCSHCWSPCVCFLSLCGGFMCCCSCFTSLFSCFVPHCGYLCVFVVSLHFHVVIIVMCPFVVVFLTSVKDGISLFVVWHLWRLFLLHVVVLPSLLSLYSLLCLSVMFNVSFCRRYCVSLYFFHTSMELFFRTDFWDPLWMSQNLQRLLLVKKLLLKFGV